MRNFAIEFRVCSSLWVFMHLWVHVNSSDSSWKTLNLMIWENLFVGENSCLWLFKISSGMQDENLRSMACISCHCRHRMSAQSVTIATRTFKFIPKITLLWSYQAIKVWPLQLLWQHSCDVIPFLQWYEMHAMLLRFLYPRHLWWGVYSFRLSICMFVCPFVIPSRSWNYFKVLH